MENAKKHLVAYYRVSSKRQKEEGVSIDAQKKLIHDYCFRLGYSIVKEFEIDESAKKEGRKTFQLLVKYVLSEKNVDGIVGEKVDRVLRGNLKDRVIIEDLINDHNKEIHFVKESLVLSKDSKSAQKLQFDIQNALARHFLNNLSDEVKKGYDLLVDNGFYPHIPPIGYKMKLENHTPVIDASTAPFIKRIYELCASGDCSEKKIANLLYSEGFRSRKGNRVGKSVIGKILHDPFYYGHFIWNGELKQGNYAPIIDKELYDKVQEVLSPKKKRGYKHDFAFIGLMKCGECGNGVTAETQKGHIYYHCTKPKGAQHCLQKYVREEVILAQLEIVIKKIALGMKKIKSIKEIMQESLSDETQYVIESLDALNSQYNDLQNQSAKLLGLYLKGKIKEEIYNKESAKLNLEIECVNDEIAKNKKADRDYHQEIGDFLSFCNEAPALFKSSRAALKRELLHFVVSNLTLKDGKVDYKLKMPFDIVAKYAESENWQARQDLNPECPFWRGK